MRRITLFFLYSVAIFFISCKKGNVADNIPITNILVVNGVQDIVNIKVNTSMTPEKYFYSQSTEQVANGFGRLVFVPSGSSMLIAVDASDTMNVLFNNNNEVFAERMYSLFLAGNADSVDAILKEEVDFPFIEADVVVPSSQDSVINVRFVNLAKGSPELKVTLSSSPAVSELGSLNYKDITDWKKYSISPGSPSSYVFQIRRADNNTLLLSRAVNISAANRFKSVAIVIKGVIGGTGVNAFSANLVNYF